MSRVLIVVGLWIMALGVFWPWLGGLPSGQLPGDIAVRRETYTIVIPLGIWLLIGGVSTLPVWLFRR